MFEYIKDLNYDEEEIIESLAEAYMEFVDWNKGRFDYEVIQTRIPLKEVFIAHNIFDDYTLDCGYDFVMDIYGILNEYVESYTGFNGDTEAIRDVETFFSQFNNKR